MAKKKKTLSQGEAAKIKLARDQTNEVRSIFKNCGFLRVHGVSNHEITFEGTTSEFDDIYLFENIIVVCELTTQKEDLSGHVKKKKVVYDKINADPGIFVQFLEGEFPDFNKKKDPFYNNQQMKVAILYCSLHPISEDVKNDVPGVRFLDFNISKYFKAVSDRIKRSARYELLAFLKISHDQVGRSIVSPAAGSSATYKGSILPEGQSYFPNGYKVVSFYVDPAAMLKRCYVLRKDGWNEDAGLYQRMIRASKIKAIRAYLLSKKRVFVNNIIVTMPDSSKLADDKGNTIDPAKITKTEPVNIQLPYGYNTIGLIDGQHRIFSYYEGGNDEAAIASLRAQQNLLVTGIIYPSGIGASERAQFEARLFLEINSTQTNAKSDLKQAIGLLLEPYSQESIARRVVDRLNQAAPLRDEFEKYFFDKGKIKITSVVSYGVRPIVRFSGDDTFFKAWTHADKDKLLQAQGGGSANQELLDEYIKYCVTNISVFVGAVKANCEPERWTADKKVKGRLLTTTIINGMIVCLRHLIENGKLADFAVYNVALKEIKSFEFSKYKSSQYGSLGESMFKKYFAS